MLGDSLLISNFILKGFKAITFLLDHIVYWFAQVVYKTFYYLTDATLLNSALVEGVTRRIYAILGVVMIFILAFNLLNYIIDPDKINDKKVGATSVIKDIVIALVVLSLLPMAFTKLYSLQSEILTSNVIANLILGGYSDSETSYDTTKYKSYASYLVDNGANNMVANVYVAFLYPVSDDGFTVLDCPNDYYKDYCDAYDNVKTTGDIDAFKDLYARDDYNYFPLLSTVGGLVLLFFMLSFCLNMGMRAGKLALLQLIAPIPVVMEILPNKKGTRKTWLDTLIKTFLEVFMYMAIIYIVILLISMIPSAVGNVFKNASGAGLIKVVVIVMLIFGLLQFGKEAPKMIFDILGIKSSGTITAGAKRGLAMAGVTGGLIGSTVGRFSRNFNAETNTGFGQRLASGLAGAGSGFARTLWGARNVHNLKDAKALRTNVNQKLVTARVNRSAYTQSHGGTLGGAIGGHINDLANTVGRSARGFVGYQNNYEHQKMIDRVNSEYQALYNSEVASIWKKDSMWSQFDSMASEAKALEANGQTYYAPNGQMMTSAELRQLRDARKRELVAKNGTKLMEGAGKLNNFIDTHQGVPGVTDQRFTLDAAIDPTTGEGNVAFANLVEDRVITQGAKPQLDALKRDTDYQSARVAEKVREDAKAATKKAAEDANKQGKK